MGISFSRLFSNYKIALLLKFSASTVRAAIYVVIKICQKSDTGNSKKCHGKKLVFCVYFQNGIENYTAGFRFLSTVGSYTYWLQKRGIFLKSDARGCWLFLIGVT